MGPAVPIIGRALTALAAVAALSLSGCSFEASVGGSGVDQGELEQQISDQLAEQVGQAPEAIDCPGDLDAEVGTTMQCTLTDAGQSYPVSVEVTSVDTDTEQVLFDIEVGQPAEG